MTQASEPETVVPRELADHALTDTTFADMGVSTELVDALAAQGMTSTFPIQAMAIPDGLAGLDVCGKAKTGSGKTLAFGVPMINRLSKAKPKRPRALVLVPTRELANQVTGDLEPLLDAKGLSLTSVYGGVSMSRQIKALRNGVELVIATPGRLIDLMDRREVSLADVATVTIDEADQMADMGFLPQVNKIMREIKGEHQTYLFSATLDGQVGSLIRSYMRDPVNHEVASTSQTVDTMEHRFLKVHHMDKVRVAAAIANSADRTLMFVRTKFACDRVARDLRDEGIEAVAIHGDRHQRQREQALADFTSGKMPVLVATNVAARGLHVEGVDVVIHYDPPDDPKTYVHRSGRTARAGESGLVVTLVEWDQVNEVLRIQKQAGLDTPIVKMFSNDERLSDLSAWMPPPPIETSGRPRRPSGGRRRRRL